MDFAFLVRHRMNSTAGIGKPVETGYSLNALERVLDGSPEFQFGAFAIECSPANVRHRMNSTAGIGKPVETGWVLRLTRLSAFWMAARNFNSGLVRRLAGGRS
jgi:hypothetical protein